MKKILIVDDEKRMRDLLELFLKPLHFECVQVSSGYDAINRIKVESFDLILLDIMMPIIDGWETCEKIRTFSNTPILMLTARDDKSDVVKGLNIGADDYLTKPFDENELIARVNALLRRSPQLKSNTTKMDGFELDSDSYSLIFHNQNVSLTLKEYKILEAFMHHPERTYTREQLLLVAWDYHAATDIRTVDSHMRNLRDKLKKAGFPIENFIVTVWGIGYKWR